MGSWLSNGIKAVGKGLKDTGHAVGTALNNPYVKGAGMAALAASGVGLPLAAAIGAGTGAVGGALRPGGGLKGAITQGAQGAALGAGASLGGSAIKAVGSRLLGGTAGSGGTPGAAAGGGVAGDDYVYPDAGGGGGGWLDTVKGLVGGAGKLLPVALGAGAAIEGVNAQKKANELQQEGLNMARDDYKSRGQFRDAATPRLLNPSRPDLSAFADPGNPYRRGVPRVGRGAY